MAASTLVLLMMIAGFCLEITMAANLATFWVWVDFVGGALLSLVLFGYHSLPSDLREATAKELDYPGFDACFNWASLCGAIEIFILAITAHFALAFASTITWCLVRTAVPYFKKEYQLQRHD
jgi:hypothetical protein